MRNAVRHVGDDSAAESDASSLSDYDLSSDPMDRFTVTALPMASQPPSGAWHSQHQQQQPQQHFQQQYQQHDVDGSEWTDDSAHNGRQMSRVGQEGGPAVRPELAAMRGRADSAREMPVSFPGAAL